MVETCKKALDQRDKYGFTEFTDLTEYSKAFDCLVYDLVIANFHARVSL